MLAMLVPSTSGADAGALPWMLHHGSAHVYQVLGICRYQICLPHRLFGPHGFPDSVGVDGYPGTCVTDWHCLHGKPILRTVFSGDKTRFMPISKPRREFFPGSLVDTQVIFVPAS